MSRYTKPPLRSIGKFYSDLSDITHHDTSFSRLAAEDEQLRSESQEEFTVLGDDKFALVGRWPFNPDHLFVLTSSL